MGLLHHDSPTLPSPTIRRGTATILLAALATTLPSCASNSRVFLSFGGSSYTPESEAGEKDASNESAAAPTDDGAITSRPREPYWVRFQDLKFSHRDLLRHLDNRRLSSSALDGAFEEVIERAREIDPDVPASQRGVYEQILASYVELRRDNSAGLNRDILRQRLEVLEVKVRRHLSPEALESASKEKPPS